MAAAKAISPELAAFQRAADRLARRRAGAKRLPSILILTDPLRTPDPVVLAERLPPGAGLVYRHFGVPERGGVAARLAAIARERRLVLLIGADWRLALACGAHGVHLPERDVASAPWLRARWPDARITVAAHGARALARAAQAGADAALLSPVLPSLSPSAGRPLGSLRTAALARGADLPVYGLGGVNARTLRRLAGCGLAGVVAVGAALTPP